MAIAALAAIAAALTVAGAPPAAAAPASFTFKGSGWGHGVGLSQYGALEQASDGRNYRTILGHYYTGTSIGSNDLPATVRVYLAGAAPQVTVEAGSRFNFTSGGNEVAASAGGDGKWVVRVQSGRFVITRPNGAPATGPVASSQPLKINYEPWNTVVAVSETTARYRWGKLELSVAGDKIRMILDIALEPYVRGIAEVPSSWPTEALRAQAVAARTYAADKARRSGHNRDGCDCTLFADTRDQVYRGYEREDPAQSGTARWVAAVNDTARQVVVHGGHPIQAYYHSSSGGKTESSADVWSSDLPYLRSVDDPWSLRSSNPYARWEEQRSQEAVARALGMRRVDAIEVKSRTAGGGIREATVRGTTSQTMRGSDVRSRLNLRSIKFSIAGSAEAFWTAWSRVASNDRARESPAMVAGGGVLHAAVSSPSGVPYAAHFSARSGWSRWSRIGPASSYGTGIGLAPESSGRVHVVVRGRSGEIYTASRDPSSGSWSRWSRIGPANAKGYDPAIAAGPDGVVWVVVRGHSAPDAYATRRATNGEWSRWTKVGSGGYEPTVAGTDGGAIVVARGADKVLRSATFASGRWGAMSSVNGGTGTHPELVSENGRTLLAVHGRSADRIYTAERSGSSWSSWSQVSSDLVSPSAVPLMTVASDRTVHLVTRAPNDAIYAASRGTGGWSGFFEVGDANDRAASGTSIVPAAIGKAVYVMLRGPSQGLYWSERTP